MPRPDDSFTPSRPLEWAYRVGVTITFLPISASGALYLFAGGEHTRLVRGILAVVSVVGAISLSIVKRWYNRERDQQGKVDG